MPGGIPSTHVVIERSYHDLNRALQFAIAGSALNHELKVAALLSTAATLIGLVYTNSKQFMSASFSAISIFNAGLFRASQMMETYTKKLKTREKMARYRTKMKAKAAPVKREKRKSAKKR